MSRLAMFEKVAREVAKLNPRWNHTSLCVKCPQETIAFYQKNFGMKLIKTIHFKERKVSMFFMNTPKPGEALPKPDCEEASKRCFSGENTSLKFIHYHGTEELKGSDLPVKDHAGRNQLYNNGNTEPARGFGHIAFNSEDVYATCALLEANGVKFKKKPDEGRMKGLAFALDPDGYWVEIVSKGDVGDKGLNLSQTMLRVKDPEKAVPFFEKFFNMAVVSERHFEPEKGDFSLYFLTSKTPELQAKAGSDSLTSRLWQSCLELTWNHGTEKFPDEEEVYHNGVDDIFKGVKAERGFANVGFVVDDVVKYCELLESAGIEITKRPDVEPKSQAFVKCPDSGYNVEVLQRGFSSTV